MAKKIFVLDANPRAGSFCAALAENYVQGAKSTGHEVRVTHLRQLRFDLNLAGGYVEITELEPELLQQQEYLRWCEHFVLVTPLWWMGLPALLKGYFDRVFLPGFAFKYRRDNPFWDRLLAGRSARVIYTQDSPQLFAKIARRDCFWHMIHGGVLGFCGFKPVRRMVCSSLRHASDKQRNRWLDKARQLGSRGQ